MGSTQVKLQMLYLLIILLSKSIKYTQTGLETLILIMLRSTSCLIEMNLKNYEYDEISLIIILIMGFISCKYSLLRNHRNYPGIFLMF